MCSHRRPATGRTPCPSPSGEVAAAGLELVITSPSAARPRKRLFSIWSSHRRSRRLPFRSGFDRDKVTYLACRPPPPTPRTLLECPRCKSMTHVQNRFHTFEHRWIIYRATALSDYARFRGLALTFTERLGHSTRLMHGHLG